MIQRRAGVIRDKKHIKYTIKSRLIYSWQRKWISLKLINLRMGND